MAGAVDDSTINTVVVIIIIIIINNIREKMGRYYTYREMTVKKGKF